MADTSEPALLTTEASTGEWNETQSFLTLAMLSCTYFWSVVPIAPVIRRFTSVCSASANKLQAVCKSPESGASSTPPERLIVASAVVNPDVNA